MITELLESERNTYWRTGRDWSVTVGGTDLLDVLLWEFALAVFLQQLNVCSQWALVL